MANTNLIATSSDVMRDFNLFNLTGQEINNDGDSLVNLFNGLVTDGSFQYLSGYRFLASTVDGESVEIVTIPSVSDNSKIKIVEINMFSAYRLSIPSSASSDE